MYRKAKPGQSLKKDERVDFAAKALVRYTFQTFSSSPFSDVDVAVLMLCS